MTNATGQAHGGPGSGPEAMARPEAPSPSHAGTPGAGRQPAGWREKLGLYLICDLGLAGGRDPVQLVELALAAGVRAVQLRAKATPDRVAYQVALALRRVTARYGALLIVNDRLDLALAAGADGVHLGQDDLPAEVARRLWPAGLLGVSVRTAERARAAERAGADYLGAGALRSTSTKPDSRVIGLEGLRAVVQATRLPVVAIGGIRPEDVPAVRQIGAAGVAVASAILQAEDVRGAAKAFLTALTTT